LSNRKEIISELEKELKTKLYACIPGYIFSNDLFEKWIKETLKPDSVWIDAGCGNNSLVEEFSVLSKNGTGIDCVIHPELLAKDKFIKSSLSSLPFGDSSVDLIVSNMVVEHLEQPEKVLGEYLRVLKPGGKVIFRTTNKLYPTLFLGHIFSKKTKDRIINRVFGVESHDIFPTHYKVNTYRKILKTLPQYGFKIERLEAVEDLHLFNRFVFRLSKLIYKVQKLKPFYYIRNTLVCMAIKPII